MVLTHPSRAKRLPAPSPSFTVRRQCIDCTAWFDSGGKWDNRCDDCAERVTLVTCPARLRGVSVVVMIVVGVVLRGVGL